jgi:hypothetical protein
MLPPVVTTEESPDGLSRQRWIFVLEDGQLVLERFHHESRKTKDGQYQTNKLYDREYPNGGGFGTWEWLTEESVPWSDSVKQKALAQIPVGRWRLDLGHETT